jgi:hypothetical protein
MARGEVRTCELGERLRPFTIARIFASHLQQLLRCVNLLSSARFGKSIPT